MKVYFKFVLGILGYLFILETFAYWANKEKHIQQPFFISINFTKDKLHPPNIYRGIDPLLGWFMPTEDISKLGFMEKESCVYFKGVLKGEKALVIYISGGSTSDMLYSKANWPYFLHRLLLEKK